MVQQGGPVGWMLVRRQLVAHALGRQHRGTVGVRVLAHGGAVHVRVVAVAGVHVAAGGHALHHLAPERVRRRHPLFLLPPIAEPHSHNLLFELQAVGQRGYLLGRGLGLLVEVLLEGALHRHLYAGALFPLPALGGDLVDGGRRARRRVRLLEPLLEERLQLAHVLEAQLKRLEPADRRLGEDVAVKGAEREADVSLREAELDPSLLELLGEGLQVVARGRLVFAAADVAVRVLGVVRALHVAV